MTVLFTDLVGSTELRSRLGEEGADRLRYVHDELVTGAIETGGGVVIKSTGDGVMATFAGAADAVGAAVAVQQAIDQHNRRDGQSRLSVRIGLSVGDVTIEADGDCFGLPVVEAQRLEATAAPDQILCSALVRGLARGRGDHRFNSVGELQLKGLSEGVLADEVLWDPLELTPPSPPSGLPPLLYTGTAFALAGRSREVAALTDAWKASQEGPGYLALLAGEPGIGKTRLVSELATRVLDEGGLVLAGRSDEDLNAPFGPFVGALTWWAAHAEQPLDFGDWPADLLRLAPEMAEAAGVNVAGAAGDADASLVIRAVRSWLVAMSRVAPTLLVLDDLHWADSATSLLLRSLFDREPVEGLCVVGTYRDTDLDRRHPLAATLADLRRHPHVSRLSIGGLDQDGVAEFLTFAAGYDLDTAGLALASTLWGETAGNPFFVGEVLRHLAETGAIVERDGGWTTDLDPSDFGIPEGIREVVGRRLTRLGEQAEKVLSTSAVVGLDFDVTIVADVTGDDVDDVIDALEVARAAALVHEVTAERWRFSHAIVRDTLLDELSSSRRVRQHRKVASAIEEQASDNLDAVANQLAYHWGETGASGADSAKALAWGMRAGDLALAKSATEDAVRWYEHALGLLDPDEPTPAEECSVLIRLARARALLGNDVYVDLMLRAAALAEELDDHEQLTAALVITKHSGYTQDEAKACPQLIEHLEAALALVGDDEPGLRAQLLSALSLELLWVGEGERRVALCEEAYELALASADVTATFAAVAAYFYSYPNLFNTEQRAIEYLETQRTLMDGLIASGDGYRIAIGVHMLWYYAMYLGRNTPALEAEALGWDLLDSRPTPLLHQTALNRAAMRALISGDLVVADEHIAKLELLEEPGPIAVLRYVSALEGGYVGATIPLLERALATPRHRRFVEAMFVLALVEIGDSQRANTLLDARLDEGIEQLPDDTLIKVTIALLVETGIALRRVDRIEDLVKWGAALHDHGRIITGVMDLGHPGRLRGGLAHLQGNDEAAVAHFRTAIEANAAIGAKVSLATTRLDWAGMLLDSHDYEGAATLASVALDDIGDLPLLRQRRRAEAILKASASA